MASRIQGITVEIGGDTTKLSKALESVNKSIKGTQSGLKDVNKLLKLDPSNTELVVQKQKMLKDAIEATKEKLATLKTAAQQANEQLANGEITQQQYDALQREIVETEQNLRSLQDQAATTNATLARIDEAGEKLQNIGSSVENVGKKFLPVTAAVTGLGTAAVKTAADFDSEMSKVSAISGATGDDFDQLRAKAREMGAKTKFSASEAASAMEYMAMAGWKTGDMLNGIEGVMNLAAASGEDLATTSDIVTDALTAFGLSAADSGHFADILAAASSNANTNVSMMGETFKYCAPIAGALGFSAEDTAEAIGLIQTTALIPVDTACQKVYYTGQVFNWIGVAGYDANGTFVASILDSRDTEQPQEYKEKELEIPEGVFQIRASSYAKDLSLKVCGESAKLWNQVQRERQNQKKMAVEIEALRSADDALAKETMTSLNLPFLYDGVSNIWEGSSPVLQTYYVPLTVLRSVFIQEIQFTLRTIGETTLTAMLESEEGEVFRQSVELVKGDNRITLILHRFIDEGAYKLRVRSTDKVLYYPVRPNTGKEIRNDFFSNEPSGNVEYDYKNRLIVFMGKILIGTGKVDTTLSYSGMAADAAVVGQAFKDEREYTDTLASGKLDAVHSRNLLDPSRYRPGWFAYVHSSVIQYHADNLRYGSTDYIPVSEKGLVTKGSGTNGVTSQVVFDKAKKALRYVDANDQYTYQEGDAYVMFFYMASSGQKLCVVEGTEYVYEAYTDYKPLDDLKQEVNSLQTEADNQKKQLTNLTARLDQMVAVPEKKDLRLAPAAPVYTVCNNLSTARNYHVSVWVDHLIAETGWKDRAAGFGTEMEERFDLYSPFTNTAVNSGEDVLEQTVEKSFVSDVYKTQKLKFKHRSTLASMGKNQFPKILVIGDSVTDGYLAGVGKTDADLPIHYWSWVRYLFDLDRKDAKAAETEYRCLMVGMPGTVNGKHYGSSSSFKLDGKTVVNYAMGKGGWSAEDLNLATFESASNINPFYDEKTKGFSLKACLDKYRTLADNGMTRLIPGETAGTEVKDANAYDLCTPTHVVINLNHNSSLAEYKANIPDIVKTIKREYPEIIVILMSIDETGTYFPAKYPEYRASEITLGGLHSKNVSIYQYFCDELQDEANGVYVCSGHLIQPAVESYPTLDYVSADSVGRQSGRVLHMAYGRGQYGGPNWHPNNYAHCAWGYQLYALVKYTLALQDMK